MNCYHIIVGGSGNTISNNYANTSNIIVGGVSNTISDYDADICFSTIINGTSNGIIGNFSTIINGTTNCIVGNYSTISAGYDNTICALNSSVVGNGLTNTCNDSLLAGFIRGNNLCSSSGTLVCVDAFGTLQLVASDIRCKTNIVPIGYGLNEITKMNPIAYNFVDDKAKGMSSCDRQLGFSAQDLEKIIPESVGVANDGIYTMKIDRIIPVMVKAIQELKSCVDSLK